MFDETALRRTLPDGLNPMSSGTIAESVASAGVMLTRMSCTAHGQKLNYDCGPLNKGDIAILRFLAVVELIESDLWQQYEELGGVNRAPQSAYQRALRSVDGYIPEYISSNALDEVGHASHINAYLKSEGADCVNLDEFRTLRGSSARGARNIGRLTNLMHLDINTDWYVGHNNGPRYNFVDQPPQIGRIVNKQAIPRTDSDCVVLDHVQAIAHTAVFHFGYIEHACSTLYAGFSQQVKKARLLKIMLGIGGDEIAHFMVWVDVAGSAIRRTSSGWHNSGTHLAGRNLVQRPPFNQSDSSFQPDVCPPLLPGPLSKFLMRCPTIPLLKDQVGVAVAAIDSFTQNGLFIGQSQEFLGIALKVAAEADAAMRV